MFGAEVQREALKLARRYAVITPKGRSLLAEIDRKPPIGFKDKGDLDPDRRYLQK